MKVVLIERSFLEKEAEVEDMLSMLEQEKEVPWNAYVMTTESCDRLAQTEGKLDTLLGNYLEELLENTSGIDQKAYPTLGMLYEERANHLETLYIPFVDIEGEQSGACLLYTSLGETLKYLNGLTKDLIPCQSI